MERDKIEKLKTVGIILGTFVITLGIIISIAIINFNHAKAHPIITQIPKSKRIITLVNKEELINVDSNLKTSVCEVIELPKPDNKNQYQIVCDDSEKYGFTDKEIIDKNSHSALKVGDTVYLTIYKDGKLMVKIENK
ncbi:MULTISPECIES: hypothetical protein [unclassified Bacillus (in: firmicutes)]|uniref:hypothetical protein n=1 Tax=unclassified Bacillus (in: firmicutes) TaxID=185979 RepID=UPI0008F1C279|nr:MULTISPECIES: hypothetical protein [unclassified Bacillus (in: firmicutes)]PGZ87776.1 hypothetical protein COE53_20750 [Bacillus sp. AFS029533]SFC84346.1 hypothetical protein SAMN02799633_01893 [Bacillus sp. UNCCL81]